MSVVNIGCEPTCFNGLMTLGYTWPLPSLLESVEMVRLIPQKERDKMK